MTASVVTFTVQAGTGGRAIAQTVASRLGYSYLEEEIVLRTARFARVSPAVVANSERWLTFSERLFQGFALVRRDELPSPVAQAQAGAISEPVDPRYYRFFVDRVVLQAAQAGAAVIVGHAAQVTLRGRGPGVCNVLIHGTPEARSRRIAREEGITEDVAMARLRRSDREQADFLKHVYQADLMDPGLYQLALNTDDLADSGAAEVIARFATKLDESSVSAPLQPAPTHQPARFTAPYAVAHCVEVRGRTAPSLPLA